MIHFFDDFYYNATMLSKSFEKELISDLLYDCYKKTALSKVSELVDINNYSITKREGRIRKILKSDHEFPFEFVFPLN
jgi:hypothetical protein